MNSTRIWLTTAVTLLLISPQAFAQRDSAPPAEDSGVPAPQGDGHNPPPPRDGDGRRPGPPRPWMRGNNNNDSNFNGPRGAWRPQGGSRQNNSSPNSDSGERQSGGRPSGMGGPYGVRPFRRSDNGQNPQSGPRGAGNDERRQAFKQEMVDRFDANHNGKLDPDELQQMRGFMERRREMKQDGSLAGTNRGADSDQLAGGGAGQGRVRSYNSGAAAQGAFVPNAKLRIIQHNSYQSHSGNSAQGPDPSPNTAPKDSRLPEALQE